MKQKVALVCGSSGFIGSHLVKRLQRDGYFVRGLSRRYPEPGGITPDDFNILDLRYLGNNDFFFEGVDECYQLACEVGGLGYILDSANNADMLRNSTQIDINVLEACRFNKVPKIFFASSGCVYAGLSGCYSESDADRRQPTNEFGWQKRFAERLYMAYGENYGLQVRIGRLFNTYGPGMPWRGGREKSVAALCRKVAMAAQGAEVELWGNGFQKRSFTYVDDAVDGIRRVMDSEWHVPINIGPAQQVAVGPLLSLIGTVAGKEIRIKNLLDKPTGVRTICCNTAMQRRVLGWEPPTLIADGLKIAYPWVEKQVLDAERGIV